MYSKKKEKKYSFLDYLNFTEKGAAYTLSKVQCYEYFFDKGGTISKIGCLHENMETR